MICNTYIEFYRTLADPAKMEIINSLKECPKNVSEISNRLRFEQSRVSHNLRRLKELGFVEVRVSGKNRIYTLNEKTIKPLLNLIKNHVDRYYHRYCKCKGEAKKKRWNQSHES